VDVVNDEDLNVNLLLQRHEPCFLVLVSPWGITMNGTD
jgi:hypothetical protein